MALKNVVTDDLIVNVGGKVGTSAGWVVGAGNNIGTLATMAASQTGGTLVVPITRLRVGDTIEAFYTTGCINSAGNTVTLDVELRKLVAAAAATHTDSSVASMTQISKTAATLVNSSNSIKSGLTAVVAEGETYYALITGTTAGSTTISLGSVVVRVRSVFHK